MFKRLRPYVRAGSMLQPGRFALRTRLALLVFLVICGTACKQSSPTQLAQERLTKAREYAKQGKVDEAIIEYRRAIQADSKLAILHFELSKLYIDRQDYLSGAQQLNITVQLEPSNQEARLTLADIFLLAKNYDEAKEQADAVLVQHPGDPRALLASEWKTVIPDTVKVRVVDSTADYRWMVLPVRPSGTEGWDEDRLAAIVREGDMIGVTVPGV